MGAPATGPARSLRYVPALDGMRAIAVLAVVAYHLGYGWARGGFLGVDTFFVLSGYLITSLLLLEWKGTLGISLGAFWGRRARRLLPALLLLLTGVAIAAVWFIPAVDLDRLRSDAIAALFYVANWRFIASGQSYFDLFAAPSPLRHLWSLAIEEQFYLIWPLVVVATFRAARNARRALVVTCLVGIAVSVAVMATTYVAGDPSRAYYGTDARLHTILVGCLLAVVLGGSWTATRRAARPVDVLGLLGLGAIVVAFWRVSELDSALYHGGTLLFALAVVPVVLAAVGAPGGLLSAVLSIGWLRWIGRLSYGIYLWHWPLIVWLTPDRTGLHGLVLDGVRVGATFVLASLSFYLVEQPIRHARFTTPLRRVGAVAAVGVVALSLLAATAGSESLPGFVANGRGRGPCPPSEAKPRPDAQDGSGTHRPPVRRHLLLVGDSAACSLTSALATVGAAKGYEVTDGSVIACGVVADEVAPIPYGPKESFKCHDIVTDVEHRAFTRSRPDLVVWTSVWETYPLEQDGAALVVGSPRWRSELLARMDARFRILGASGAHLVLLAQPPPSSVVNPNSGNRIQRGLKDALPFRELDGVYREFARRHPGRVTVLDLNPLVCRNTIPCPDTVSGVRTRFDGTHYTTEGAMRVARWLYGRLSALGL
ncbi:MAG: acyltransferase family protein [Acidimicrobiia bacterium]